MNVGDRSHSMAFVRLGLACLALASGGADARADHRFLPPDFNVPQVTWAGAGGGVSRVERAELGRLPLVLVADLGRSHADWQGENQGTTPHHEPGHVYDALLAAGWKPVEIWMVDLAGPFDEMSSVEEATDDLKLFIAQVMQYTGAPGVVLVAQGRAGLLARLTITKYHIGSWIAAEIYLATPFGGDPDAGIGESLAGSPNDRVAAPGSDILREVALAGAFPVTGATNPTGNRGRHLILAPFTGDRRQRNPFCVTGVPCLEIPGMDPDGLRTSRAGLAHYLPFALRPATPCPPDEDQDGDGFCARWLGGADCDDEDASIHPGAREIPKDGIDQDCNGCEYHPELRRDGEVPLRLRRGPQ